jgi:S1-C subfamily serine protease
MGSADRAGSRGGTADDPAVVDVIRAVEGRPVPRAADPVVSIDPRTVGDNVTVRIVRGWTEQSLSATPGTFLEASGECE